MIVRPGYLIIQDRTIFYVYPRNKFKMIELKRLKRYFGRKDFQMELCKKKISWLSSVIEKISTNKVLALDGWLCLSFIKPIFQINNKSLKKKGNNEIYCFLL